MIDTRKLRNCFGKFATGVTVVTARDRSGNPVGLTVNSFSSLSLSPPLILWSLDNKSFNRQALERASHFGVSVLAADQIHLSQQFAMPGIDKFQKVEVYAGKTGVPLIAGAVAHFECLKAHLYEGGDHMIYIGQVEYFDMNDKPPLLFADGAYAVATRHPLQP